MTWLHDIDRERLVKGRKVLMLLDNCLVHPVIEGLRAIELLFLPPSCTFVLQPMDQGIIPLFKFFYGKESLKINTLRSLSHSAGFEIFTKTAWDQAKPAAIENFKHGSSVHQLLQTCLLENWLDLL